MSTGDRYSAYESRPPVDEGPGVVGYLAIVLSWLVPGLGHLLIGEKARGIVFAITIHLLFGLGLLFGGIRSINPSEQPIWTYTQFLCGWPMLVANNLEKNYFEHDYVTPPNVDSMYRTPAEREYESGLAKLAPGDLDAKTEYSKKFIEEHPLFAYHPKVHDMGSVYCGIAGMLNLLVMFDVLLRVTGSVREDPSKPKTPVQPVASNPAVNQEAKA